MNNENQFVGRQRLAWGILLAGLFVCLLISITIPLAASAYIQNATQDLNTIVQANQGTVGIDDESGVRRAVLAGDPGEVVEPESSILTDSTAIALLTISSPVDANILARFNVDANTAVHIREASTPRFNWSSAQNNLNFDIESGRTRLTLLESDSRPLTTNLSTPQGIVNIEEAGQYAIEVSNDATRVSVEEGAATLLANDSSLRISADERAEIPTGANPRGPLDPERNIVENGDFSEGFNHWSEYTWKVELEDQPKGSTDIVDVDGEPVLRFERSGVGHADARVLQSINQNIVDYDAIRLLLTMRIIDQSLGVCGIQGSECPLFVRVNYIDESGVSQIWQQGFYASGAVDDNLTPGACISCAVIQSNHESVPLGQEHFFQVDFRQDLAKQGALSPREIESIELIASGHSFTTEILDAAMIVE